ncbi:hypothetical protein HZC32_00245 [Candidatus Woesearchaeota archaeon]|nr:hypothetical protein [Candidatus Woesearchaeota archaeon]
MVSDDLKNLPPEERIKKLKEIEQQKRKEIEDAQRQITESEKELGERLKLKEKVPIPEVASEEAGTLAEEAKEIIRVHRGKKIGLKKVEEAVEAGKGKPEDKGSGPATLEALTRGSKELPPELINSDYAAFLSQRPMWDLYEELTKINDVVEDKGYINREEERRVDYMLAGVERKREAMEAGKYSFTEEVAWAANLTQQLGSKLRGIYQRGNRNELPQ